PAFLDLDILSNEKRFDLAVGRWESVGEGEKALSLAQVNLRSEIGGSQPFGPTQTPTTHGVKRSEAIRSGSTHRPNLLFLRPTPGHGEGLETTALSVGWRFY
ncbi:MAG: hypothetical protein K0U98_01910, partial [Deltaproteobacteria bacterium]|nr:hypothetical protein [Deltaproteobacteria bacterium]